MFLVQDYFNISSKLKNTSNSNSKTTSDLLRYDIFKDTQN